MRKETDRFTAAVSRRKTAAALAIAVWMGLLLKIEDPGKEQLLLNLIASFHSFDLARLLMLPGLYFLFHRAFGLHLAQKRWSRVFLACFFALNMVLGTAFAQESSWNQLLPLWNGQLIKAGIIWLSWGIVFYYLLTVIFSQLDSFTPWNDMSLPPQVHLPRGFHPLRRYTGLLINHPFLTPFLTLLILFFPHFLIAYPAMFMGDTWSMIVQGYSELKATGVSYIPPESVLRTGVYINQHHPVAYTLLLHGFLQIGDALFHSLNVGIFLLCLGQALAILASFSYLLSTLSMRHIKPGMLILLMLYIFLHPQIRNYMCMATKDGLYSACFLLLMAGYFRILTGNRSRRNFFVLGLAAAGIILLRNEGKYVLLFSGLLMVWLDRKNRKALSCYTAAAVMFSLFLSYGLYPALGYTRGGTQEALSVPFQQTARVVRDHPEDISNREQEIIDQVLDYSQLAEKYDQDTADHVKILYRQDAEAQELLDYFRVWVSLLLRHPDTCFQATYGNYFQYLFPGETRIRYDTYGWSSWMCEYTNEQIADLGKSFSLPEWNRRLRYISDSLVDAGVFQVPPFSLLMTPSLYSWTLITLLFWVAGEKKSNIRRGMLALTIPSLITFLVLFAGPTNAWYTRYMLPLTSSLPFLILLLKDLSPRSSALSSCQKT